MKYMLAVEQDLARCQHGARPAPSCSATGQRGDPWVGGEAAAKTKNTISTTNFAQVPPVVTNQRASYKSYVNIDQLE